MVLIASLLLIVAAGTLFFTSYRQTALPNPTVSATSTERSSIEAVAPTLLLNTSTPTQSIVASPTQSARPTDTPAPFSTSPQGKIVFACQTTKDSDRNQICLIDADGSNWKRLSSDDAADHTYPHLAPDGQAIIFSYKKFGSHQIYEMDLSGNMRQLSELPFEAYAPSVSPNNQKIVFTTNDGSHQSLWIMGRNGENPFQLTTTLEGEAWDPVWSSDGTQILYASNKGGEIQLFLINVDGSNARRLTSIDELRGRSDWSPTAQIIATYKGPAWQREIVTLSLEGNELEQITDGGNNLAPNFSPDGQWIAFTSYRDHFGDESGCEIYVMRIDGTQITRLTNNDYCDWQPNWGP